MALWKVTNDGPSKVKETNFISENLLEEKLEDWIASDSSILGEPLLIIGKQVQVSDVLDKLDLLALDPDGNAVVIEVKRDHIKTPNDMQVIRYASYISKWGFNQFESVANSYLGKNDKNFNFLELYENFCKDNTVANENIPTPNQDQRMILVGGKVKEKLGSVALWLRDHKIDIKVVEVHVYKDDDSENLLFEPDIIIPTPVSKFIDVGKSAANQLKPWKTDGRDWHLQKKCSDESRQVLNKLLNALDDIPNLEGPNFSQQGYISFQQNGKIIIALHTMAKLIAVELPPVSDENERQEVMDLLELQVYNDDGSLSLKEKLAIPSSVAFYDNQLTIRCKSDFESYDQLMVYIGKICGGDN